MAISQVSWCSWLSRQSNTLKVSGSSPGEANLFFLPHLFFPYIFFPLAYTCCSIYYISWLIISTTPLALRQQASRSDLLPWSQHVKLYNRSTCAIVPCRSRALTSCHNNRAGHSSSLHPAVVKAAARDPGLWLSLWIGYNKDLALFGAPHRLLPRSARRFSYSLVTLWYSLWCDSGSHVDM